MTNLSCKTCQGAGVVPETLTTKIGGRTITTTVLTWCPTCNQPRRDAEQKAKDKLSKKKEKEN